METRLSRALEVLAEVVTRLETAEDHRTVHPEAESQDNPVTA
jgi:hypothetical protein